MTFYTHTTINGRGYLGSQIMHWKNKAELHNAWFSGSRCPSDPPNASDTIDEMLRDDVPWASVHGANTTTRITLKEMQEYKKLGVPVY